MDFYTSFRGVKMEVAEVRVNVLDGLKDSDVNTWRVVEMVKVVKAVYENEIFKPLEKWI